eukprot:1649370-Pleurochrysis_carterae.AAC.1
MEEGAPTSESRARVFEQSERVVGVWWGPKGEARWRARDQHARSPRARMRASVWAQSTPA